MAEYIDRQEAKEWIADWLRNDKYWNPYSKGKNIPTAEVFDILSRIPATDVQPVKWIPVTERLPDFEGCLLCMSKTAFGLSGQDVLYYEDGEFSYNGIDKLEGGTVTHWMPLPKPPKEETA